MILASYSLDICNNQLQILQTAKPVDRTHLPLRPGRTSGAQPCTGARQVIVEMSGRVADARNHADELIDNCLDRPAVIPLGHYPDQGLCPGWTNNKTC